MTDKTKQQQYSEPVFIYRLQLNTPDPSNPKENAAMMFGIDGDTPEILVWPRSEAEKGKGPIRARLNTTAFGRDFVYMLRKAADSTEEKLKLTMNIEANRKTEDGRMERKHVSTLVVAKRSDGVIVIGLYDQDTARSRILFPLTQMDWVQRVQVNNEPIDEAEVSRVTARYYADFFEKLVYDNALKQTMQERKRWMDEIKERRERLRGENQTQKTNNANQGDSYEF